MYCSCHPAPPVVVATKTRKMNKRKLFYALAAAGVSLCAYAYFRNRKKLNPRIVKTAKAIRQAWLPGGTVLDQEILDCSDKEAIE